MGALWNTGLLAVVLGIIIFALGSRSRGEMKIRLGFFKGPIWFLLIIFGLFLMALDIAVP